MDATAALKYFDDAILGLGGLIFGADYADPHTGGAKAVKCFTRERKISVALKE